VVRKQLFVIVYDIRSNKARKKVADLLENEGGQRINLSVFELMYASSKIGFITQQIEELIDASIDRVAIYPICKSCFSKSTYLPDDEMPTRSPLIFV